MDNTTQQALDPYSWSQILNYYKNPNLTSENLYNVDESLRPIKFQPQYSYAQMRYMQNKGLPMPAPRYNVAEPTGPLSDYANQILNEYNRTADKKATAINNDVLNRYLKTYNVANDMTLQGLKDQMAAQEPQQTIDFMRQILNNPVYNPSGKTAVNDTMLNAYIKNYNLENNLNLADVQQRIADEFNASRQQNQSAYDTQANAYRQNLARYNENPAAYYGSYTAKPTATSTNPYLQSLYTSAGVNQPPQQMANGGLVQDQFANYGTQLRNIPPLSMIRGGK